MKRPAGIDRQSFAIWRENAFVDGAWVGSDDRFPVDNPANGEVIASVTNCTV